MRSRSLVISWLVVAVAVTGSCGRGGDPLRNALRSGDWGEFLPSGSNRAAIALLLRGHALLDSNRNNEAGCAFTSTDREKLKAYSGWTRDLVGKYRQSAVANYLRGDALARSSAWSEAILSFDHAVALDRGLAVALVGRAAVRASTGDWEHARNDLYAAEETAPHLAEVESGLGWVLLQGRQPAEKAAEHFEHALQLSPGYALASAGVGFATMASGNAEKGARRVAAEMKPGACLAPLLALDSLLAAEWLVQTEPSDSSKPPGTDIQRRTIDFSKPDALDQTLRLLGGSEAQVKDARGQLQSLEKNDPLRFRQLSAQLPALVGAAGAKDVLLTGAKDFLPPAGAMASWAAGLDFKALKSLSTLNGPLRGALGSGVAGMIDRPLDLAQERNQQRRDNLLRLGDLLDEVAATRPNARDIFQRNPSFAPDPLRGVPMVRPAPPGGVDVNLAAAYRDKGTWTIEPLFGLAYRKL